MTSAERLVARVRCHCARRSSVPARLRGAAPCRGPSEKARASSSGGGARGADDRRDHRLAWLAKGAQREGRRFRAVVVVPSEGLGAHRAGVAVRLGVDVPVPPFDRPREGRRRAFPDLAEAEGGDATPATVRLKRDPALGAGAGRAMAARAPGGSTTTRTHRRWRRGVRGAGGSAKGTCSAIARSSRGSSRRRRVCRRTRSRRRSITRGCSSSC